MKIEGNLAGGKSKVFRATDVRLPALMASLLVLATTAPAAAQDPAASASKTSDGVNAQPAIIAAESQSADPQGQPASTDTPAQSTADQSAIPEAQPAATDSPTPSAPAGQAVTSEKPVDSNGSVTKLDTVVVTARRRSERLQDVPLSISAFRAKDLDNAGVKTLQDLSALTSGLTLNDNGTESKVLPTIRGLSDLSPGSTDNNVAIFLDGIYQTNPSAVNLGLVDIQRIEVVKGPVSALYGRNAYAGAINYVSQTPDDFWTGHASGTIGNYGQQTLQGAIGGPIAGKYLTAKIAVGYDKFDGSYRDNVTNLSAGGHLKKDGQLTFESNPIDHLVIDAALYYGDDFFGPPALAYTDNNCGPVSNDVTNNGQFTQYCGKFNSQQHPVEVGEFPRAAGTAGNTRSVQADSLRFSYDLGWSTVSLLNGYNKVTAQNYSDFTGHRDGIPFPVTTTNADGSTTQSIVDLKEAFGAGNDNEDVSSELRFASKIDQRLRWALGGYFFHAHDAQSTLIGVDGAPLAPNQTISSTNGGFGLGNLFLTPDGSFSKSNFTLGTGNVQAVSEFASLDFDLLKNLTLGGEYRHTDESETQDILRNAFFANTVEPLGPPIKGNFSFDNHRGTVRYKLTRDIMFYGTVADGTKAGGFNRGATIPSELVYQPETSNNYELGTKTRFLDGKLQVNLAAFYIVTRGLQVLGPSDDPKNVGLVTKNIGGVDSKGLELDVSALLGYGLTNTFGLGYADATFKEGTYDFSAGDVALCPAVGCGGSVVTVNTPQGPKQAVSLDGRQTPQSSKLQLNDSLSIERPLYGDWKWFSRGDVRYETKQYATNNLSNINYWGDRTKVNLRAGAENQRFRITAYVDNVTNDQTPAFVSFNTGLNNLQYQPDSYLPTGRTYGLKVDFHY